jgi:hypothetical protein
MTPGQSVRLKKRFLEDFAQTGNVTESCQNVGIRRRATVYDWQERDDEFVAGFREAEIKATEVLETAARRRAVDGVTTITPILHRGRVVYQIAETKYSDTLLIFLLKARAPEKYRDNVAVSHSGQVDVTLGSARRVLRVVGGTGG